MSEPEVSLSDVGSCFQCLNRTHVVCLPCSIKVCAKCFVSARKSKNEDYRRFVALQPPKRPPGAQKLFCDEFKVKNYGKYSNLKDLNKDATTEWYHLDEGKRQEFHRKREVEKSKYQRELSNYRAECQEYQARPFECPFCGSDHSGKQFWIKNVRNVKSSPAPNSQQGLVVGMSSKPPILSLNISTEESDTCLSSATMSTAESQDPETALDTKTEDQRENLLRCQDPKTAQDTKMEDQPANQLRILDVLVGRRGTAHDTTKTAPDTEDHLVNQPQGLELIVGRTALAQGAAHVEGEKSPPVPDTESENQPLNRPLGLELIVGRTDTAHVKCKSSDTKNQPTRLYPLDIQSGATQTTDTREIQNQFVWQSQNGSTEPTKISEKVHDIQDDQTERKERAGKVEDTSSSSSSSEGEDSEDGEEIELELIVIERSETTTTHVKHQEETTKAAQDVVMATKTAKDVVMATKTALDVVMATKMAQDIVLDEIKTKDSVKPEISQNETTPEKLVEHILGAPSASPEETPISSATIGAEMRNAAPRGKYTCVFDSSDEETTPNDKDESPGATVAKQLFTYQFPESMRADVEELEADFSAGMDEMDSFDEMNDNFMDDDEMTGFVGDQEEHVDYEGDNKLGNVDDAGQNELGNDVDDAGDTNSDGVCLIDEVDEDGQKDSKNETSVNLEKEDVKAADNQHTTASFGNGIVLTVASGETQQELRTQPQSDSEEREEDSQGEEEEDDPEAEIHLEDIPMEDENGAGAVTETDREKFYRNKFYSKTTGLWLGKCTTNPPKSSLKFRQVNKFQKAEPSAQYREDDFSWKPAARRKRILGPGVGGAVPDQKNKNEQGSADDGGFSKSKFDKMEDVDFMSVVENAIQEADREELARKEKKFLKFVGSSCASKQGAQSKRNFFESAMASELNKEEEDELPNLPDSRTVDYVVHGKSVEIPKEKKLKRKAAPNEKEESPKKSRIDVIVEESVEEAAPNRANHIVEIAGEKVEVEHKEKMEPQNTDSKDVRREKKGEPVSDDELLDLVSDAIEKPVCKRREETAGKTEKAKVEEKSENTKEMELKKKVSLKIKETMKTKVRSKWSFMQSIPSFDNDTSTSAAEDTLAEDSIGAKSEDNNGVVTAHTDSKEDLSQEIKSEHTMSEDELLDLVSGAIEKPICKSKKKRAQRKEEEKVNILDTDTVEIKEEQSDAQGNQTVTDYKEALCVSDEETDEYDVQSTYRDQDQTGIQEAQESMESAQLTETVKDEILDENGENKKKVKAKLSKLRSPRLSKKRKSEKKNLKNVLGDLMKQKVENIGKMVPLGQMIKFVATERKRNVEDLDSSDTIGSDSSDDELAQVKSPCRGDKPGKGEKGKPVRLLRKRKAVESLMKIQSEDSSGEVSQVEVEAGKSAPKSAPKRHLLDALNRQLSEADMKRMCMSPRLVLHRLKEPESESDPSLEQSNSESQPHAEGQVRTPDVSRISEDQPLSRITEPAHTSDVVQVVNAQEAELDTKTKVQTSEQSANVSRISKHQPLSQHDKPARKPDDPRVVNGQDLQFDTGNMVQTCEQSAHSRDGAKCPLEKAKIDPRTCSAVTVETENQPEDLPLNESLEDISNTPVTEFPSTGDVSDYDNTAVKTPIGQLLTALSSKISEVPTETPVQAQPTTNVYNLPSETEGQLPTVPLPMPSTLPEESLGLTQVLPASNGCAPSQIERLPAVLVTEPSDETEKPPSATPVRPTSDIPPLDALLTVPSHGLKHLLQVRPTLSGDESGQASAHTLPAEDSVQTSDGCLYSDRKSSRKLSLKSPRTRRKEKTSEVDTSTDINTPNTSLDTTSTSISIDTTPNLSIETTPNLSIDTTPNLSLDTTTTNTSLESLPKVDGAQDKKLSRHKRKRKVSTIVIADSTTTSIDSNLDMTSFEVSGTESSIHIFDSSNTGADSSIHILTGDSSKESIVPVRKDKYYAQDEYVPGNRTESDEDSDSTSSEELYTEFLDSDRSPDVISLPDLNSSIDFIVDSSDDNNAADSAPKRKPDSAPDSAPKRKPDRDSAPKHKPDKDSAPKRKSDRDSAPKRKPDRDSTPKHKPDRDSAPKRKPDRDSALKRKPDRDSAPKRKPDRDSAPKHKPDRDSVPKRKPDKDVILVADHPADPRSRSGGFDDSESMETSFEAVDASTSLDAFNTLVPSGSAKKASPQKSTKSIVGSPKRKVGLLPGPRATGAVVPSDSPQKVRAQHGQSIKTLDVTARRKGGLFLGAKASGTVGSNQKASTSGQGVSASGGFSKRNLDNSEDDDFMSVTENATVQADRKKQAIAQRRKVKAMVDVFDSSTDTDPFKSSKESDIFGTSKESNIFNNSKESVHFVMNSDEMNGRSSERESLNVSRDDVTRDDVTRDDVSRDSEDSAELRKSFEAAEKRFKFGRSSSKIPYETTTTSINTTTVTEHDHSKGSIYFKNGTSPRTSISAKPGINTDVRPNDRASTGTNTGAKPGTSTGAKPGTSTKPGVSAGASPDKRRTDLCHRSMKGMQQLTDMSERSAEVGDAGNTQENTAAHGEVQAGDGGTDSKDYQNSSVNGEGSGKSAQNQQQQMMVIEPLSETDKSRDDTESSENILRQLFLVKKSTNKALSAQWDYLNQPFSSDDKDEDEDRQDDVDVCDDVGDGDDVGDNGEDRDSDGEHNDGGLISNVSSDAEIMHPVSEGGDQKAKQTSDVEDEILDTDENRGATHTSVVNVHLEMSSQPGDIGLNPQDTNIDESMDHVDDDGETADAVVEEHQMRTEEVLGGEVSEELDVTGTTVNDSLRGEIAQITTVHNHEEAQETTALKDEVAQTIAAHNTEIVQETTPHNYAEAQQITVDDNEEAAQRTTARNIDLVQTTTAHIHEGVAQTSAAHKPEEVAQRSAVDDHPEDDEDLIVLKEEPMDVLSNMYTCREHGLTYKIYCETAGCDMMLCAECLVRGHLNHSVVTLEQRYETVAQRVAAPLQEIAELRLQLARLHQNVRLRRDEVERVHDTFGHQLEKLCNPLLKIYNPFFLKKHVTLVTRFYTPRLVKRLNTFNSQLDVMEGYTTELRKIESCLKAVRSEHRDDKAIMALRNYHAVLKSLEELKVKVREFKAGEVEVEEIWQKYGLGQILRGSFEEACDGTLDMCMQHLYPVWGPCRRNGFSERLTQLDSGFVFKRSVDLLQSVEKLCANNPHDDPTGEEPANGAENS